MTVTDSIMDTERLVQEVRTFSYQLLPKYLITLPSQAMIKAGIPYAKSPVSMFDPGFMYSNTDENYI